jgi:BirA family transcriptional regulator, biotin operon repressor / biotin---[acetyl-CoA-carboxylase] ligase
MTPPIRFEHVARIDSTNAALMRRPFADAPQPPTLLLADEQTAGRGRNARRWWSDPARSLTLSLSYEGAIEAGRLLGLPLAVGVALADELARHGARTRLKWPNDLYCASAHARDPGAAPRMAKAGGVLVEVRQQGTLRRVVVGCGLNLADSDAVSPSGTGQPVAALFAEDAMPERVALARSIGAAVLAAVRRFVAEGLEPFAARWDELDWLAGHPVDVLHPDGRTEAGIARGIDAQGALRVDTGERIVAVLGGEVSVRRR